jgi:hypothetical protein
VDISDNSGIAKASAYSRKIDKQNDGKSEGKCAKRTREVAVIVYSIANANDTKDYGQSLENGGFKPHHVDTNFSTS